MSDKTALRRMMRAKRRDFVRGLAPEAHAALCRALADRIIAHLPEAPPVVGSYVAMGGEIDPAPAANAFHARGSHLAFPRVDGPDQPLGFHRVDDPAKLLTGFARIPEPPRSAPLLLPDLILVPLVAADPAGNRLGQGAGHYDRTLAALSKKKHCIAIGLAWDIQILPHLPADPWDASLDAIATPTRWIVPRT